jgi:hypothetical protein
LTDDVDGISDVADAGSTESVEVALGMGLIVDVIVFSPLIGASAVVLSMSSVAGAEALRSLFF